jgi:hypothetical protein
MLIWIPCPNMLPGSLNLRVTKASGSQATWCRTSLWGQNDFVQEGVCAGDRTQGLAHARQLLYMEPQPRWWGQVPNVNLSDTLPSCWRARVAVHYLQQYFLCRIKCGKQSWAIGKQRQLPWVQATLLYPTSPLHPVIHRVGKQYGALASSHYSVKWMRNHIEKDPAWSLTKQRLGTLLLPLSLNLTHSQYIRTAQRQMQRQCGVFLGQQLPYKMCILGHEGPPPPTKMEKRSYCI